MRACPAWLSVSPTRSTVSARAAIRSRTRRASGVPGSEISAEVRAVAGITSGRSAGADEDPVPGRIDGIEPAVGPLGVGAQPAPEGVEVGDDQLELAHSERP